MKTAISISDTIFGEAERLARRMKKSRSRLYSEALAEYVARHAPEAVTEKLDEVCAAVDSKSDSFQESAARRILERSEW